MFLVDNPLPSESTDAEKFLYATFSEQSDGSEYGPDFQTTDNTTATLPAPVNPAMTCHKHTAHGLGTVIETTKSLAVTNKRLENIENIILDTYQTAFEGAEVGTETHQLARQAEEAIQETNDYNWVEDESAAEQTNTDSDENHSAGEPSVSENIDMTPLPSRLFRYSVTSTTFAPWIEEQVAEYISTVNHLESLCSFFDTEAAECDSEVTNTKQEPKTSLTAQNLSALNTPSPTVPQVQISEILVDLFRLFEPTEAQNSCVNMDSDLNNVGESKDEQDDNREDEAITSLLPSQTPGIEATVADAMELVKTPVPGVDGGSP